MSKSPAATLHDLLREWPYAREYLLETLDQELIERHALMHLARGLNTNAVVAFLGAGVSMCYGRISWGKLVAGLEDDAKRSYEALTTVCGDTFPRLKTLYDNIKALQTQSREPGDDLKSDRYPSVFQLCAELQRGVAAEQRRHTADAVDARGQADDAFLTGVKARTRDGHFHAMELLVKHLPGDSSQVLAVREAFQAKLYGATPQTRKRLQEAAQRRDIANALADRIAGGAAVHFVKAFLLRDLGLGHEAPRHLPPALRFLVPAAILAHGTDIRSTDCGGAPSFDWGKHATWMEAYADALLRADEPAAAGGAAISSVAAAIPVLRAADPIEIMHGALGIRRFLTTNYDLELEHAVAARGFRPAGAASGGATRSVDPLGRVARDFVVRRDAPGVLADFAAREGRFVVDIAHLHGRALPGEGLVAAETQYQDLYLRDDGHRDLLDQSLALAFRGNTLLFVGNGMGEDDILRPLRHFMSEGSGPTQPPAIALLPGRGSGAKRAEDKISLLRRYGVYTLHFGRGAFRGAVATDGFVLPAIVALIGAIGSRLANKADAAKGWKKAVKAALKAGAIKGDATLADLAELEGRRAADGACAPDLLRTEWHALAYALRAANDLDDDVIKPTDPRVLAARVIAAEVQDAVLSAFLAAMLQRLEQEWRSWQRDWFAHVEGRHAGPPLALPGLHLVGAGIAADCVIDRRHALELRLDESNGPAGDRLFRPRNSQSYHDFLMAVAERKKTAAGFWQIAQRRVFVLAGRRGLGKGHLFHALTSPEGLQLYAKTVGIPDTAPLYGAYALNLSFSVEIGSAIDRMAVFLLDRLRAMHASDLSLVEKLNRECADLMPGAVGSTGDRLGAIDLLLRVLAGQGGWRAPPGRVVIAINGAHLLFNARGYAKNAAIRRLMALLLDKRHAGAALDLFLIMGEAALPIELRSALPTQARSASQPGIGGETAPISLTADPLPPLNRDALDEMDDDAAITRLRVNLAVPGGSQPPDPGLFFHRVQPPRISVVILTAFPRVALAVAADAVGARVDKALLDEARKRAAAFFQERTVASLNTVTGGLEHGVISREAVAALLCSWLDTGAAALVTPDRIAAIDRAFGRIYKDLDRSRLCVSIVCAAADEVIDCGGTAAKSSELLNALCRALGGSDSASREDTVIRAVTDHYRMQSRDNPDPKRPDFALQEELLAALAIIGQPVQADCLSMLNLHALPPGLGDPDRTERVREALNLLVRRCLVFRFTARGGGESYRFGVHRLIQRHVFRRMHQPRVEFPEVSSFMPTCFADQPNDLPYPSPESRDAVRDMVVRLSFFPSRHRLGLSGTLPQVEPRRAARMLRAAYGIVRSVLSLAVVARFDAYVPGIEPPGVGFLEEHRLAIRWLIRRAVAIDRQMRAPHSRWSAEQRARRLRRLIDQAKRNIRDRRHRARKAHLIEALNQWRLEFGKLALRPPVAPALQIAQRRDSQPFFDSDVAWLHNECGVISLAQGRLQDAAKLFSMGLRAVQRYEAPKLGGAETNILRLNRAIVDAELGKCRKAESVLIDIASTPDEHRAQRWIATGYRGFVAQVRGETTAAMAFYEDAVKALRTMRRYRAAAIFARHRADLIRRDRSAAEAVSAAEEAVALASIGNHADIHQLARLTRLRTELTNRKDGDSSAFRGLVDAQRTIADVAAYARIVGVPRIALEAAHLDADLRFEIGDFHYATRSTCRGLSLANELGMVLKKISLMLLLAKIHHARGLPADARLLAESARDLAISTEYAFAQDEAQRILAMS